MITDTINSLNEAGTESELREQAISYVNNVLKELGCGELVKSANLWSRNWKKYHLADFVHISISLLDNLASILTTDFKPATDSVRNQTNRRRWQLSCRISFSPAKIHNWNYYIMMLKSQSRILIHYRLKFFFTVRFSRAIFQPPKVHSTQTRN